MTSLYVSHDYPKEVSAPQARHSARESLYLHLPPLSRGEFQLVIEVVELTLTCYSGQPWKMLKRG
jgi:hypothetical protein